MASPDAAAVCLHTTSSGWTDLVMFITVACASLLMLARALFGEGAFGRGIKSKSSTHLLGGRKNLQNMHQQAMQNVDEAVLADIQTLGDSVLDGYCTIKKATSKTTWKKRWVVVDAYARVKYYSNAEGSRRNMAPKGTFTVLSVDVAPDENPPTLEVRNTLGGTYFFHFDDDFKMQKWLVVLKSRAMQSAITGRLDPLHGRDPSSARMRHGLTALVETFDVLAHKDTSMRSFFAVIKFKAELHDHSGIPVKQTNQRSCSSRAATWNESLNWSFDDHECATCDECKTVGLAGSFSGLPDLLVVNIFEVTMRVKTTKIGRVFVSLKDLFGPNGLTKSSIEATWPILASSTRLHDEKESILGTLKMKLDYTATSLIDANSTTTITPFLSSDPSDLELLGEFELDIPLQEILDEYYADQPPPPEGEMYANPVWARNVKERGETELEIQPWQVSAEHGGWVRILTFRSLTHAPIGPSSTMTTNVWHMTGHEWGSKEEPNEVKFEIKVKLHDIPYGDIFTVEHSLVMTKTATNGIAIKVYLAIPFTSGCMFKSKIISQTKTTVLESYAQWFRLVKEMHNQGGGTAHACLWAYELLVATNSSRGSLSEGTNDTGSSKRTALVRMSSIIDEEVALEEIFENQRMHIFGKWGPNYLWPTDRPRFSNRQGDKEMNFNDVVCPPNWTWTSEWKVDMKYTDCDEEGWSYATDFPRFKYHLAKGKSNPRKVGNSVRRRRWVRTMCLDRGDNGPL
ncbi:hypothetical protein AC1031_017523 [Aphanomyces cochlioides]|nr:hypothetical protein AC1031_017523 [Aphanomyces cochlioides]